MRIKQLFLLLFGLLCLTVMPATAGSFALIATKLTSVLPAQTVTTLADNVASPPSGSLRAALNTANAAGSAASITFNISGGGTINLAGALPILSNPNGISIDGANAGQGTIVIDGGASSNTTGDRIFLVGVRGSDSTGLAGTPGAAWQISNVTLQNGNARGGVGGTASNINGGWSGGGGGAGLGGAIFVNEGNATLSNVQLLNNRATGGNGGILSAAVAEGGTGGGGGMGGGGGNGSFFNAGGGGGFGLGANGGVGTGGAGSFGLLTGATAGGAGSGTGFGVGGGSGGGGGGSNSNQNGGGGGPGGEAGTTSGAPGGQGKGGNGGFAGGGGAGGGNSAQVGGNGGYGGGGGGAGAGDGGFGGFGGGGGGGAGSPIGAAGFGGGNGAGSYGGGGGGAGLGAAVFVRQGASLSINGSGITGGSVAGGSASSGASVGSGSGTAAFLAGPLNWSVANGQTVTLASGSTLSGGSDALVSGGLTKSGAGTLVLNGSNNYVGPTAVSAGQLQVNASLLGTGAVSVANGAILSGSGTLSGATSVANGGTLAPGQGAPGRLNTANTALVTGATFAVEISGATVATQYDQLKVTGTMGLGGATLILSGAHVPSSGQSFVLVDNDGSDAVTGTFAGLAQGGTLTFNGVTLTISYTGGDGNDVVLTVVDPSVSIAVSPASVSEDGGTNLSYTVTRNASLPAPTTVNITTTGTANSGSDYTGAAATVVIAANATTATIIIDPTADSTVEADETVILAVATGSGYTVGSPSSATGTINNDDNAPPTISNVADQTISEDGNTGALAITVGDAETPVASLTMSGTSSNTALVPTANIVFGGSGANRTVTVTPVANVSGTSTITLTVTDGNSGTASDTVLLTVNAVNDAPSFTVGANQTRPSGTNTAQTVPTWATAISDGDPDFTQTLTFNVTNNNNGLFSTQPSVAANGTLNYAPNGTSGSATVSVSLTDDATAGGAALTSAVQTFTITVSANTPPTISDILNQSTIEDTATNAIAFTVSDAETAVGSLTVSGTSSNTTLVPNANIVFGGSGANRTVTITPTANLSGTSTITVTVNDGTANSSDSFVLTVNAVNDAPSFTVGANQTRPSGTNTAQTVPTWATAISDGDPDFIQALTFNVTNNNNGLFTTQPSVAANGTLNYTPNGTSGSATVSVSLTDDNTAGGTALTSAVQTFTITIQPNTPPIFAPEAAITRQQGSAASFAILGVVSDLTDPASALTVAIIPGGTATGVSATNLFNTIGSVTANLEASCTAASGTVRLAVTDLNSLTGTGDFQVNVTPNTPPTLSYASINVGVGASATQNPATGLNDNGGSPTVSILSQGTYTGTILVSSTGVLSLNNATPAGSHTISVRATDNCGANTDVTVQVNVAQASTIKQLTSNVNPARFAEAISLSVQVAGVNPTGSVEFFNGATSIGTAPLTTSPSGGNNLKLATLIVSNLAVGTSQSLTARYVGDVNNAASTSPVLLQSVIAADTRVSVSPAANPATAGSSVISVTVQPIAPGGGVPQGSVAISSGASNCVATLTAGAGSCALNFASAGFNSLSASYSPTNVNHNASMGGGALVVVATPSSTDLRVRIGNGVSNIGAGQTVSYLIVVDNLGSQAAVGRLEVPISSDLTGASYTCISATLASCSAGGTGTGSIDLELSLAPGGVVIYRLNATAPSAPERVINQAARVTTKTPTTDTDTSNNDAADLDPMGLLADGYEDASVSE